MQYITSRGNPLVVSAAALKEKKFRDESGMFLLEGRKLLEEAVRAGTALTRVFVTEDALPTLPDGIPGEVRTVVPDSVLEKISTEKAPQGMIGVAPYLTSLHTVRDALPEGRLFLLSSVRDPGNLGTVLRTAAAFGTDTVLLSADCADLYNPKTVRASMGAVLRQKTVRLTDSERTVKELRAHGYEVYAAMLDPAAVPLPALRVTGKTVFAVGNEGHGIDPSLAAACTGRVFIPMAPDSMESLNVSAASAVLLWQSFLYQN